MPRDPRLETATLNAALKTLPLWLFDGGEIVRTVKLSSFPQAVALVNRVAELAEAANHHPDIDIRYNKVRFALVTHDSDGITQRDVALAAEIDTLYATFKGVLP